MPQTVRKSTFVIWKVVDGISRSINELALSMGLSFLCFPHISIKVWILYELYLRIGEFIFAELKVMMIFIFVNIQVTLYAIVQLPLKFAQVSCFIVCKGEFDFSIAFYLVVLDFATEYLTVDEGNASFWIIQFAVDCFSQVKTI